VYLLTPSVHAPAFLHGFGEQSLVSCGKNTNQDKEMEVVRCVYDKVLVNAIFYLGQNYFI